MLSWFRKGFRHENTRQYIRLPAAWPVKVEPLVPTDGRQVSRTEDVGAGGISMITREMIPLGTSLRLQVHIPPIDRTFQAEGRVVRCQPLQRGTGFDVGVCFTQITPADQAQLKETLEGLSGPSGVSRKRTWWRSI